MLNRRHFIASNLTAGAAIGLSAPHEQSHNLSPLCVFAKPLQWLSFDALADYLVQQHGDRGRFVYLHFLQTAHEHGWEAAIQKHYSFKNIDDLERNWGNWVMAGSPRLQPEGQMLADAFYVN